jgi:undecaprenyl-diphosphatase
MVISAPNALDLHFSQAIQHFQPGWLNTVMRAVSDVAAPVVLIVITLVLVIYLFLQRKYPSGTTLLILAAGNLLTIILKNIFNQPRPSAPLVHVLTHESSYSFPSGHAIGAVLFAASIGVSIWPRLSRTARSWAVGYLTIFCLLVGYSRVYLGVHWLTDVVYGFAIGLAWALGCMWLFRTRSK